MQRLRIHILHWALGILHLSESSRDVVFGFFLFRVREELFRRAELYCVSRAPFVHLHEGSKVGDPRGLLHIVGDDNDGELLAEWVDLPQPDEPMSAVMRCSGKSKFTSASA
jgi:hypothetical protein